MTATLLALAVSVLPVFLFLGALVLIDSYKLVSLRSVLLSVVAGVAAALAAYLVNVSLRPALHLDPAPYSRYVAPLLEESLKAAFVVLLLKRSKVGFVVDAAIHGFAIGTGFAFLENLYYVQVTSGATLWTWIVRGFGTAVMHGGATAIVAMVAKALQRSGAFRIQLLLPGLAVAVLLHSLYNHFLVQPFLATALIVLVFPWLAMAVFEQSERETRAWLGAGFDTDQELLKAINTGHLGDTPSGMYIRTLKGSFAPEVIFDLLCLLRLHAELAIRAKGVLMMREAGFDAPAADQAVRDKLGELKYLEKSIGTTGMLAIGPFLHTSTRDLWQLNLLEES